MTPIEEAYAKKLMELGVDEAPARKAGCVLNYFRNVVESEENFPANRRIPEIWRGMKVFAIDPYVEEGEIKDSELFGLTDPDKEIYRDLDSIAIGLAVGLEEGLLNVCEHTKYSISARGSDFIRGN